MYQSELLYFLPSKPDDFFLDKKGQTFYTIRIYMVCHDYNDYNIHGMS